MAENGQFEKTSHNALAKEFGRYALIIILLLGLVSASDVSFVGPTPKDNYTMFTDWVYINITSSGPLDNAILELTNSSGSANYSMTNGSMSAWSVNMTGLADGTYSYALWAQQLAGGEWSMGETRHVLVDTMQPYGMAACQDLTVENGSYVLTQDVSSDGTCFTIKANNITLDGQGNTITYAKSSSGYAVDAEFGYDYAAIKNFRIMQDNTETGYTPAIYLSGVDNGTISNNVIVTSAELVSGIYLHSANSNTLSNNTITTSGVQSFGIDVYSSGSNVISNNEINMSGSDSHGIEIEFYSNQNVVSNNSVAVLGDSGFGIRIILADSNAASYNNLTASGYDVRAIYLEESNANNLSSNTIASLSDNGYGLDLMLSNANTLLNNTLTLLGSPSYGMNAEASNGNIFSGTTITAYGNENYGINILASSANTFFNNTVTQSGEMSHGVWLLESSDGNVLLNNTIAVYGPDSWGIRIASSVSNNVTGGSITSGLSYDYYLEDAGATNNFTNTNFTKQRRIWFNDGESWFNYAEGNRSIKTHLSSETMGELKRAFITGSSWTQQPIIEWSDANASGIVTAVYELGGLLANTQYYIRDTSTGNLTHLYELVTDADGNLPAFSMGLKGSASMMAHILKTSTSNLTVRDRNGHVMENVTVHVRDGTGDASSNFELNSSVTSKEFVFDWERKYDITYLHPAGNTLELRNAALTMNATVNPQFVDSYSGMLPSSTTMASYVIALNTTGLSFDSAEITILLSSAAANRILHCLNWDYSTAVCSSWESNSTSSYNGTFNSTHFVFNVTSFDAYMAGVYTVPPTTDASSNPEATTAPGSAGRGNSGSSDSTAPSVEHRGKLSLLDYPAYMNAEQGGGQVSYTFVLKNIGNGTLHDVKLAITGIAQGWFSLEPREVSELNADTEQIFILKVHLPAGAAPKNYSLVLNAASDEGSLDAVSSVFEVLEKSQNEPIPEIANDVEPGNGEEVHANGGGPTPADVAEIPSDLTPAGRGVGISLVGGSGLLFWRTTRRRRRMHKLHKAHLMAAHSAMGKKQQPAHRNN